MNLINNNNNNNNNNLILFELNGKIFCEQISQEFLTPYFFELGESITLPGYILNDDKLINVNIQISCLEVFLGKKKIHFYKGPKQERDKTKGFREKLNRVNLFIL